MHRLAPDERAIPCTCGRIVRGVVIDVGRTVVVIVCPACDLNQQRPKE